MNMVKKLAIATVFLFAATVVNASDGMRFGARVGYNMQMLSKGDADEAPDMGMLGISVGAVANIPAGPVVIAPEVAFIYRTLSSQDKNNIESSAKEMAISIPVMIKFFPIEGLFLQAGVKFDIPFGTEACSKPSGGDEVCVDYDGKETDMGFGITAKGPERAAVDIGIPLGLGYMITPDLGVDFRYVLGLTQWVKNDDFDTGSLSTIGLGVTYFF